MRIIAGKYRSRPLHSLPGLELRPTSDRLRETLFDVLTAGNPSALENTTWLDLFAGTGAVGIEALSRQAYKAYFVEVNKRASELIRRNLESLQAESESFHIVPEDVAPALRQLATLGTKADFVFLDPPYHMEAAYHQTLQLLAESTLLKPGARVIVEHEKRFDPGESFAPLHRYRKLVQGDAALSFYKIA